MEKKDEPCDRSSLLRLAKPLPGRNDSTEGGPRRSDGGADPADDLQRHSHSLKLHLMRQLRRHYCQVISDPPLRVDSWRSIRELILVWWKNWVDFDYDEAGLSLFNIVFRSFWIYLILGVTDLRSSALTLLVLAHWKIILVSRSLVNYLLELLLARKLAFEPLELWMKASIYMLPGLDSTALCMRNFKFLFNLPQSLGSPDHPFVFHILCLAMIWNVMVMSHLANGFIKISLWNLANLNCWLHLICTLAVIFH